jgi:hypothetical protein
LIVFDARNVLDDALAVCSPDIDFARGWRAAAQRRSDDERVVPLTHRLKGFASICSAGKSFRPSPHLSTKATMKTPIAAVRV